MIAKTPRLSALEQLLKNAYSQVPRDENEKAIEAIGNLLDHAALATTTTKSILIEAAKTIHRTFEFQFIAIALKDRTDGLYRYKIFQGIPPTTEQGYNKITYSSGDLFDSIKYPCTKVSRLTNFYMIEDNPLPEKEESLYRLASINQARKSLDDFHEGDYIVTIMYGQIGDVIGWIELSSPRTGKFPKKETIVWIEFISSLLATIIFQKEYGRK